MWRTVLLIAALVPPASDEVVTHCRERADIRASFAAARDQGFEEEGIKNQLVVSAQSRNLDTDPDNDVSVADVKEIFADIEWAFENKFTPAATFDINYEACKRAQRQYVDDDKGDKR